MQTVHHPELGVTKTVGAGTARVLRKSGWELVDTPPKPTPARKRAAKRAAPPVPVPDSEPTTTAPDVLVGDETSEEE